MKKLLKISDYLHTTILHKKSSTKEELEERVKAIKLLKGIKQWTKIIPPPSRSNLTPHVDTTLLMELSSELHTLNTKIDEYIAITNKFSDDARETKIESY